MKNTIFLKDVQKIFDAKFPNGDPIPFDIEVFKYSRTSKKGGDLIFYTNVTKPTRPEILKANFKKRSLDELLDEVEHRNPMHFKNKTRCIKLPNGEIRKLSFICIKSINNKEVIY